jgi:ABC-2 type transport system ATP-binding protein
MIRTDALTKTYKKSFTLDIPDLTVPQNTIFGLVGNNGAGKTTFLRLVLDLIEATSGTVYSKEQPVARKEEWKAYTGSYLDPSFLIDFLTPEEHFEFVAEAYGLNGQLPQRLERFDTFFNGQILGLGKKYIRELSAGNKQKVGIAAAMLIDPEILILDEPFSNLDPTSQIRLKKLLTDMNQRLGTTMIISSHDLSHISEVCTRIAILENGKIVRDMPKNDTTLAELRDYFEPKD